jgi:TonB family protein
MSAQSSRLRLVALGVAIAAIVAAGSSVAAAPRLEVNVVTPQELAALIVEKPVVVYPYESRRRREEGKGLFRMYVGADGRVHSIGIMKSTGSRTLDVAAAAGLIRARIKPGRRRQIDMPVAFELIR